MSQCPSKPNVPLVPLIGPEDEQAEARLFPTVEDADKFPAKVISGGYRLVEKLQRPYVPTPDVEGVAPYYRCPFARCEMMVKHIGFTRAMMEEKEDHPIRETHQEQWQAMTDGLQRAQKRLENWYRNHNPLYPECDCPIFPLLTDPWEGERALLAEPALRAIDHQMLATSLALGVFLRHRRFYEGGAIALPVDVANFFNLPYERHDPTADCPAARNYAWDIILQYGPWHWTTARTFLAVAWKAAGIEAPVPTEPYRFDGIAKALRAHQRHLRQLGAEPRYAPPPPAWKSPLRTYPPTTPIEPLIDPGDDDEAALAFLSDPAMEELPGMVELVSGYIREIEELQRPYKPPGDDETPPEDSTPDDTIPVAYCWPYARCLRIVSLGLLARRLMDSVLGNHGWNKDHALYREMDESICRAKHRLDNWYKEKNPRYPFCECVLHDQLATWWECDCFAQPATRAIDRQLVAATMAKSICLRGRESFQNGLVMPKAALDFYDVPEGPDNPLPLCPAASEMNNSSIHVRLPRWVSLRQFIPAAWKAAGIEAAPPTGEVTIQELVDAFVQQLKHLRGLGACLPGETKADTERISKRLGIGASDSSKDDAAPAEAPSAPAETPSPSAPAKRGRPKRGEFKVTQAKAALMFNVSVETIQRWDRGENAPPGYSNELRKDEAALLRYAATHSSESAERVRTWARIKAMGGYDENRGSED